MTRELHYAQGPIERGCYVAACHESGHAVVGLARGLHVRLATLRPNGNSGGRAVFEPKAAGRDSRVKLEGRIVAACAGPVAQRIMCPGTDFRASGADDVAEIDRLANLIASSPVAARALRRYAAREAEALVRQRGHAIVAVAHELVARVFLTGDELAAIVHRADAEEAQRRAAVRHLLGTEDPDALVANALADPPRPRRCREHDLERAALRIAIEAAAAGQDIPAAELRDRLVEELRLRCDEEDVARAFDQLLERRRRFRAGGHAT